MRKDQVQLFQNDYATRCDTFGCGESGVNFIGRPDAPASTNYTLCQKCSDELIASITGKITVSPSTNHELGSVIHNDAAGFRLQADSITLTSAINDQNTSDSLIVGGVIDSKDLETEEKLVDDTLGEVDYDIDEILAEANTHAEIDDIVKCLGLTNVPPKEKDGKKYTMNQRKEAILANFEDAE